MYLQPSFRTCKGPYSGPPSQTLPPLLLSSTSCAPSLLSLAAVIIASEACTKTLYSPCKTAKEKKEACESGSETSRTTNQWCYKDGCDKKAGLRREGPGDIVDGGFDNSEVDWDEFD